ncbi:MAG: PD-(D/E)XK nuclease family transposase [Bacilli bacterium]|nr:PD-(D/E)XK nuclease family transposase [Bacilli bacterium]
MYIENQRKYYTCKYDRVFKDIFLDSNDTSLLKGLLESILKVDIRSIKIQNNELTEDNIVIRRKHLDALLETNEGIINIEINATRDDYIKARNYAFLSRTYANHTLKGEKYNLEERYIQINLSYGLKDNNYYRIYQMQDDNQIKYLSNVKIYEFNMDKYREAWYTKDEKRIIEDKYLVMMNLPKEELEKFSIKDKEVKVYMLKLNRINEDPTLRNDLDYEEDNIRIMNALKDQAIREGIEQGLEQGIEQGIKQGIEQGIKQGIEQGIEQGKQESALLIAKKLIQENMSIEKIKEITNLSEEEIQSITKENH